MKTGIVVHGCHLGAFDWRGIVWGTPPHELGRIPAAVHVAIREDADLLVFGTGASERNGRKEGDYSRNYMLEHFASLAEFECFRGVDLPAQEERIESISRAECTSQNTPQELEAAGRLFLEHGIEKVILVSSPTHIVRCLRDALHVYSRPPLLALRRNLYAAASDSSYLGGRVEDVVVFEPPHRGDRGSFLTHYIVKRILKIPESRMEPFLRELDALLEEFAV
ncbi:MAG: hypothetical protein AB1486_01270 [Planctomycetota bacterium]